MSLSCVASAPGKIILAGEHAVVHGCSAIATVIDKRTFVHFTTIPGGSTIEIEVVHPIFGRKVSWPLAKLQTIVAEAAVPMTQSEPPSQEVFEACRRLIQPLEAASAEEISVFLTQVICLYGARYDRVVQCCTILHHTLVLCYIVGHRTALRVRVTTELPAGAGLGSSASYGASVVAGLLFLRACLAGAAVSPSCACLTRVSSLAQPKTPEAKARASTSPVVAPRTIKAPASPLLAVAAAPPSISLPTFALSPAAEAVAHLPRHSLCPHEKALVNSFVFEGERVFHGTPSGLDNTACTYGGVIVFKRPSTFEFLTKFPPVRLLVTNTKVEHNTKELVAGVTRLVKNPIVDADKKFNPVGHGILNAIDGISEEYKIALQELQNNYTAANEKKFVDTAISRFPINHHLLCSLGVSHPAIDSVIRLTSEFSLPSKITGAGGGGCVISIITADMTDSKLREFETRVAAMGMETFECTVGQDGVVIHAKL